jgi:hypothetical protein
MLALRHLIQQQIIVYVHHLKAIAPCSALAPISVPPVHHAKAQVRQNKHCSLIACRHVCVTCAASCGADAAEGEVH